MALVFTGVPRNGSWVFGIFVKGKIFFIMTVNASKVNKISAKQPCCWNLVRGYWERERLLVPLISLDSSDTCSLSKAGVFSDTVSNEALHINKTESLFVLTLGWAPGFI